MIPDDLGFSTSKGDLDSHLQAPPHDTWGNNERSMTRLYVKHTASYTWVMARTY
jgi:hypothetical protein